MRKFSILSSLAILTLVISCNQNTQPTLGEKTHNSVEDRVESSDIEMSNMSSDKSRKEVSQALKKYINSQNVDDFISYVKDYNETIENKSLKEDFQKNIEPNYDLENIDELWASKKGDFIGTNCRINTYLILKDDIKIKNKIPYDDSLLFLDKDSINSAKIFNKTEEDNFYRLFSKISTQPTKEYQIHAKNMEKHLSNFKFNKNVDMVSVVIHDNLDDDCLFIGHVGVLVPQGSKYLWVEKLSFQEPYQAIKFSTKDECYNYLYDKYKIYTDETTSNPFIMNNNKLVKLDAYENK